MLGIDIAIQQGRVHSWNDQIGDYLDELNPELAEIELIDFANMTSGVQFKGSNLPWERAPRLYYGSNRRPILKNSRIVAEDKGRFEYSPINADLLGLVLEQTVESVPDFYSKNLWSLLGARHSAVWAIDSHKHEMLSMSGGFSATVEDFALLGMLRLNEGLWNGHQIVAKEAFTPLSSTTSLGDSDAPMDWGAQLTQYQKCWWNPDSQFSVANDVVAVGMFGQLIYVAPASETVVVRLGMSWDDFGLGAWIDVMAYIAHAP